MSRKPSIGRISGSSPFEISESEIAAHMENATKRDVASAERRATLKAKREAIEAARLALPPVDLEDAFWRHASTSPHPRFSKERSQWLRENSWFEFKGKRWRRDATSVRSNTGKSIVAWNTTFHCEDGEVVIGHREAPNRRNDPNRNWACRNS